MKNRFILGLMLIVAFTATLTHAQTPPTLQLSATGPYSINLRWNFQPTNSDHFEVDYHIGIGNPSWDIAVANTRSTNLTLSVVPGTTYEFRIVAWGFINANGYVIGNPVAVTMPSFSAPSNLTATVVGTGTVKLNWKDTTTNEAAFFVGYRLGTNGGFSLYDVNGSNEGALGANITNFIAAGLLPGTTYQFVVQANSSDNNSLQSSVVTVKTPGPTPPSGLTATLLSPTSVKLAWIDNSTNETGFAVNSWQQNVSSTDSQGGPIYSPFPGGTVAANFTNFTVNGLTSGETYKFFVQAQQNGTNSGNSGSVTVTLPGITSRSFVYGVVGQASPVYDVSAANHTGSLTSILTTDGTGANLPPGLNFAFSGLATHQVTGTPTLAGVYRKSFTAHYTDWGDVSRVITFRIINSNGPPVGTAAIPTQTLNTNGTQVSVSLNSFFADRDTERAVHYETSKGAFDVALYSTVAPQTVSNFLNYVRRGDYDNTVVHRNPLNFVMQGGGYKVSGPNFVKTPTDPSPTNEPGVQQIRGTIAMAKLGGQPDSATDEWFFNLGNNSGTLDNQSGGFTAFGRILGTGMDVIDTINSLAIADYAVPVLTGTNLTTNIFDNVPVDDASASPEIDFSKLVYVQSITPIDPLAYSITGISVPGIANAFISGTNLLLSTTNHFGGTTVLTITATDLDGNTLTTNITVEIASPYTTWLNQYGLTNASSLPGANLDADGYPNAVEFALNGSPTNSDAANVRSTTSIVTISNQQYLALNFSQAKNLGGATVQIKGTTNVTISNWPIVWTSNDPATNQVVQQIDLTNYWKMTVRDNVPLTTNTPQRFLQLQVKLPQ